MGWGDREGWEGENTKRENMSRLLGAMEMFTTLMVAVVSQVRACVITNPTAHFQYMCSIICQLYLNKNLMNRKENSE